MPNQSDLEKLIKDTEYALEQLLPNMSDGEVKKTVEQLKETLEAPVTASETQQGSIIRVNDLAEQAKPLLSEKALEKMNGPRSKALIAVENNAAVARAAFFSVIVKRGNEEKGMKEMVKVANELAEKGLIHSILTPISSITLVPQHLEFIPAAVFFFPMIHLDRYQEVEKHEYFTLEGGIGPKLDDLEIIPEEGYFFAVAYGYGQKYLNGEESHEVSGELHETISQYLSVLPKGTKFIGANKGTVYSLALPYILKFFNPLMKDIKKVEMDYVRQVAEVNGRLENFNILTGVKYFHRDGRVTPDVR